MRNGLYHLRRKNGILQDEMAELVNLPYRTYAHKERGASEFNLSEAVTVARTLGITTDKLYELLTSFGSAEE